MKRSDCDREHRSVVYVAYLQIEGALLVLVGRLKLINGCNISLHELEKAAIKVCRLCCQSSDRSFQTLIAS